MKSQQNKVAVHLSIGNDIVDLTVNAPPLHPRFVNRVFNKDEQQRIRSSETSLWHYWAAKEAAYKAYKRFYPALIFSPISFVFDHETTLVSSDLGTIKCASLIEEDFVHVHCQLPCNSTELWVQSQQPVQVWISKDEIASDTTRKYTSQSTQIRVFASTKIAQLLSIDVSRIAIAKVSERSLPHHNIPHLFIDDQPSPHILSLSHDGRYLACTFV